MDVKKIRRIYITISILLGVFSPIVCYILLPEFNIIEHPLSYLGVVEKTNLFWKISLTLIALGLLVNGLRAINNFIRITDFYINS